MSHPVDEAISPDELARLNSIPSRILFSADYIDELVLRLLEAVDAAQTRLRSDSAGLVLALAASRADFCSRARRVQRHRSQWYDKQYEEAGAVEKALVATGRALESGGDDWLLASLAEGAAGVLSGCLDMQYRHSCVIDTCGDSFAPDVPSLSRVQGGVCEVLFAGGSGLGWCMAGKSDGARSQNVICVRCVDECGEPVRGVRTEDVSLMVEAGSVFEGSVTVVDGVYECSVYIGDDGAGGSSSCLVKISLLGEVRAEMSLKIGSSIQGVLLRTVDVDHGYGLAINPSGSLFAISRPSPRTVTMYSFPDATEIRVLGGPADTAVQFNSPYKICFTPTGNLLVAEGSSRRIQEVSVDGAHIRFVGDLVIDDWVTIGLDCTTDLIVAGKDGRPKVLVFNYATGALLRSFCTSDTVPVKLSGSGGLRITPDGLHVIVACREAHTVVMLTLDGVFVRSIASGLVSSPRDIAFTSSGHMLIADAGNSCIRVLLPDGTACITSFSSEGMTPSGMALFGGKLYVIQDSLPGRLYVFE